MIQCNFIDASSHMTVAKASEINKRAMSKELFEMEVDKDPIYGTRKRAKKNKPFWDSDSVDTRKITNNERYIETGETNE